MATPLIAVPAQPLRPGRVQHWGSGAFGVPDGYIEGLRRAGGRPVLLTEPDEANPREILEPFHGLLLMGGGDVEPSRYGGGGHPALYGIEPARDELEIALLRSADEIGLPTLAICRGIQVMNVAFGGTLFQHLPGVNGLASHGPALPGEPVSHAVQVAPGSRLLATCGAQALTCSSHHHQGIDRLGEGLVATAWSNDGLIEAIERESGWSVGVQWHPEETAAEDPTQQSLFDGLCVLAAVEAGRAKPGAREGRTRPVEIVPYDPSWPQRYEDEATRIREALGGVASRVEHVGSTAVPGLGAKPVIDIQVSVASMEPRAAYVGPLTALGYEFRVDPMDPDHDFFRKDHEGARTLQVHVCPVGSEWELRHLAFRDYLRSEPQAAAQYDQLKRELAKRHPHDVYSYNDAKAEFIDGVVGRSLSGA